MNCPIVVGTDLTESSADAIIQADARATRDDSPLTVVHAVSPLLWGAASDAERIDRWRASIQQQVAALTQRRTDEYEIVIERGLVHAVLARQAIARQALVVVGSHMHHGIGHALLRDVTERVVQRARGPVLVTRPRTASDLILVAVDTPFAHSYALDAAIEEARASGSRLTVVHTIGIGLIETLAADIVNGGAYGAHPLGQYSRMSDARQALRAELRRRDEQADIHVAEADAASFIPQLAAQLDADLVVVGTAHHSNSRVTTAVLRHASCSVLVVDESGDALGTDLPLQVSSA